MAGYCGPDTSILHHSCVWPAAGSAGLAYDHVVSERTVLGDKGWYCSTWNAMLRHSVRIMQIVMRAKDLVFLDQFHFPLDTHHQSTYHQ
jgi:hypothetical protein